MTKSINENNKKYMWALFLVTLVSLAGIVYFVYFIANTIGRYDLSDYFLAFINIFMYVSIIKYIVDYFKKGKEVSLEGALFRYGITMVAAIVAARNAGDLQFTLNGLAILFIPYLAGILKRGDKKKNLLLIFGVLALEIAIAVTRLIDGSGGDFYGMGQTAFVINACNSAVQWVLFTILIFIRAIKVFKESKN